MVVGDPFFDPQRRKDDDRADAQPYRPQPRGDRPKPLRPARSRAPQPRHDDAPAPPRQQPPRQQPPRQPAQGRPAPSAAPPRQAPAAPLDWRNERVPRPTAERRPSSRQQAAAGADGHSRSGHTFRADIEGLRAIAVLLVILYHFRLGPFHGGLVGVDVFFVLSGFLITSLLVRELDRTDTISLPDFWARRVRRLLPASGLVIVATLVAGRSLLSPIALKSVGHDALAAATFVINIVLGRRANDYLGAQAAEAAPSPLLHFWSLALEEQFYVVWPALMLLAGRARDRRRAITAMIAVLGVASLAACLYFTKNSPVWAFYLLPTRAWELLAGAALALAGARFARIPEQARAIIGWAGIAGIVIASLVISDRTSFPGYAALLPVLATVAVVGVGSTMTRNGPIVLLQAHPLQWIGKRSYAIYLWHWPVFILADAKWGPLSVPQRIGAVAVSGSLAAISYQLVEDPVRHLPWLALHARRGLAVGACLVAVGVGASVLTSRGEVTSSGQAAQAPDLGLGDTVPPETGSAPDDGDGATDSTAVGEDNAATDSTTATTSAADLKVYPLATLVERNAPIVEAAVAAQDVPSNLTPSFGKISKDLPALYSDGCLLDPGQTEAGECVYGDPNSSTKVALVGDSHAAQWFPAVEEAAKRRGWRLVVLVKKGCAMAEFVTFDEANRKRTECGPWRKKVLARLEAEQPALVLTATYRYRLTNRPAKANARSQWLAALTPVLKQLRQTTQHLVYLGDIPHPESWPATCLSNNQSAAQKCAINRSKGERRPVVEAEEAASEAADATYVKVSDWMCTAERCAVMLGNIQMYRDDNHIGATASRYFVPFIESVTVPLLNP